MASEVGQGYVSIIPSARGFAAALQRAVASDLAKVGKTGGEDWGKGFTSSVEGGAKKAGQVGGQEFASKFAAETQAKALVKGFEDLPRTTKGLISQTSKEFHALPGEMKVAAHQANTVALRELASGFKEAGKQSGREFGRGFAREAESTVEKEDVSGGISDKLKTGMLAGGVLAGGALAAGFAEAMDRERIGDKLGVQLGATGRQSAQYGKIAGNLYAGAWGDSFAHVSDAVSAVVSSIPKMRQAGVKDIQALTASTLDFATAFDIDVTRAVQVAGQMVRTGLAKDGQRAMDLLFASMQEVPAAVREDVIDAIDEYGPFFRTIGFSGQEAMSMLVEGAEKGMYGIDKTGDAVKELTIRASDMSEVTKGAFTSLGLDADGMADKIATGGEAGRRAFDKIVRGLLSIEDPQKRANTAIALFGTPLEDLAVNEIPAFLRGLRNTEDRLGKVAGTARRAGNDLNDNAATRFTEFKRSVQTSFVEFIGGTLLPAADELWQSVGPDAKQFGRAVMNMGEDMAPVAKDVLPHFANALGATAEAIGAIARQFNKLPAPLQAALIGGGLFALARGRLARGAATGVATGAAAGAAAGGVGAGTAAAGGATAGAALRAAGRRVILPAVGVGFGMNWIDDWVDKNLDADKVADFRKNLDLLDNKLANVNDTVFGWLPGKTGIEEAREEVAAFDDRLAQMVRRNPARGFEMVRRVAREAGLPVAQLARRYLPDTEAALRQAGDAAGDQAKDLDGARKAGWDLLGLWRRNLLPTTKTLTERFGLTAKEADLLRRELGDATGTGKQHEKQLRQVARQLGLTKEDTQALIEKYGDIPKRVETRAEMLTREAANARDKFLKDTKGKFSDLGNDTYAIMVNGKSGFGRIYAEGGIEKHTAQIARPGTRVWAEPETGGEAYIPLAQSKRKRSLDIWAETGRQLGVQGFADGGFTGRMNTKVQMDLSQLRQMVRETVRSLRFAGGDFPHDYTRVNFRGVTLDRRSALMVRAAESLLGQRFDLSQGSYNPGGVSASGGTHDGGGAFDAGSPFSRAAVVALRRVGWAAWRRYPSQGPWGSHIHSIDPLNRMLSPAARSQASAFRAGGEGLGGRDYEPRVAVMGGLGGGAGGGRRGQSTGPLNRFERYIVGKESGGRVNANNPSSSAFGIGQLISDNRVTYARRLGLNAAREAGDTGTTNRDAQLAMMRMYMRDRYGSPAAAYRFHLNHGWYDQGGVLKPGLTMAYNGTGQNEYVSKEKPPPRRRGPVRIRLDFGSGRTLDGWIDDRIAAELDFASTAERMG